MRLDCLGFLAVYKLIVGFSWFFPIISPYAIMAPLMVHLSFFLGGGGGYRLSDQ